MQRIILPGAATVTCRNTPMPRPPASKHEIATGSAHDAPPGHAWHSASGSTAPRQIIRTDDTMPADTAFRLVCEGTALLWQGDFQNARQLLLALARRVDRLAENRDSRASRTTSPSVAPSPTAVFQQLRQAQARRARLLGMVLIPLDAEGRIPLRRAPDVRQACNEACGPIDVPGIASLREVLGWIGAHEWRKKGVAVPTLNARIHPHYGVFAPVRGEYVDLVAQTPLPPALASDSLAFDIGTGTGMLAAVLAQRGIGRIVATDQNPRALACAGENLARLGWTRQVTVLQADLFPAERAPLIVCNPPWIPAQPSSPLEEAVYDPDSRMLRGFLAGLAGHLTAGGEGWLILSDLAEHLGLRSREELLARIADAGLKVAGRLDAKPTHRRTTDTSDPLHAARAAEVTSLWRLTAR